MKKISIPKNPWFWIPTLYFAEGIPYFVVNSVSDAMFKNLGMPNAQLTLLTSLISLPWVIKPLWSPFMDVIKTKRWWILSMQIIITVLFAALALSVSPNVFGWTLVLFFITAFASATHDIAADGFYMLALEDYDQKFFVGVRSTAYKIATVFGQGVLIYIAGVLITKYENVPLAWTITLGICMVLFGLLSFWHTKSLPKVEKTGAENKTSSQIFSEFARSWVTFFQKPGVVMAIVFMLLYRLPEAFSLKLIKPFMMDPVEVGGLGMSLENIGLGYGTIGAIALAVGGFLGGIYVAEVGLKRSMWPMSLSLALPCAVYLILAIIQPKKLWIVYTLVGIDQFGYGFGFTAYTLYMMKFADGEFKTSHYAICTAFMALSMMLPGFVAGWIQESIGYVGFFIMVMVCCLATVIVTYFARRRC